MKKTLVAKAKQSDIDATEHFLEIAEFALGEQGINEFNRSDPIRVFYSKIEKEMSDYSLLGTESDIIRFEMMKRAFLNCRGRWIKVINTSDVMVNQICDPNLSFIALDEFIKRAINNSMLGE